MNVKFTKRVGKTIGLPVGERKTRVQSKNQGIGKVGTRDDEAKYQTCGRL